MGRGPALKTLKKQHYEVAKAEAKGRLAGEDEAQRKKPLDVSLKEHIGKFIDSLDGQSIIDLGAVVSLTLIFKPIIQGSPQLSAKLMNLRITIPTTGSIFGEKFTYPNYMDLVFGLARILGQPINGEFQEAEQNALKGVNLDETTAWVMSLAAAFLVVKFGPMILDSVGGVASLVGLLLI